MNRGTIVRTSYAPSADLPINTNWRGSGACREEDPELFFPVGNTGPALLQIEEAKSVCRRCPVMERCLQWALETGEAHGVWGGLTDAERRLMKRCVARRRTTT
ncbi:WhiB family transcriptional regulator [Streptomyces sp. LaBMicrA B280]|uniref:WhiB family transcriptional regulator n=1 Tax=Streptomyces sp. LaBMicrA B280 TaxID=3391001 RepID=UPI003BA78AED